LYAVYVQKYDINIQGRTQVRITLTESGGPGPWGTPRDLKRGPYAKKERKKIKKKTLIFMTLSIGLQLKKHGV